MLSYRKEIDGLRALAILPILFYHAGFELISGGFIGVDIFFVISGYLITSILLNEISHNNFTITKFYNRRIRRILPALIVVVFTTLLCSYFFLLEEEYIDLAKSAMSALFFIPNIYFYFNIGYFGIDAHTTPLLHTWSLGVEEQFYIIYPVLLFCLLKVFSTSTSFLILLGITIFSFSYNTQLVLQKADFTFYMLPTRAWELLIGGLIAFPNLKVPKNKYMAELAGLLGLVAIFYTLFSIGEKSVFPGVNALSPVLGTALIIWSTTKHDILVAKFLKLRILVAIGLCSYSLYLWHYPLTVFLSMYSTSALTPYLIIACSLLLASISYNYIERPFRINQKVFSNKQVYCIIALASLILVILSSYIIQTNGISTRIPERVTKYSRQESLMHKDRHCHLESAKQIKRGQYCTFGNLNTKPSFAIIGDSHADSLRPALEKSALAQDKSGIQLTTAGCRPLKGVKNNRSDKCVSFVEQSIKLVNSMPNIKTIFLSGYWQVSYLGQSYRYANYIISDQELNNKSIENNPEVFIRGIQRTIEAMPDKRIIFVGDIPEIKINVRKEHARSLLLGSNGFSKNIIISSEFHNKLKSIIVENFGKKISFLDLHSTLCPQGTCQIFDNDKLIYRDGDHFSKYSMDLLAPIFSVELQ